MFNGKIIRSSRKTIEGSSSQGGWSDTWDESYDIQYDGELTDEVCEAVVNAFKSSDLHIARDGNSFGALRWPLRDSNIRVDRDNRMVVVTRGTGLCD